MAQQSLGIINGNSIRVGDVSAVPDIGGSMRAYYQPLTLVRVKKQIVDFEERESRTSFTTSGVIQPLSLQELAMKSEGQRAWDWQMLHCEIGLVLIPDEVVEYKGVKYRVMGRRTYAAYGFTYYELVNDYERGGGQ
jgi:hypothetical protein